MHLVLVYHRYLLPESNLFVIAVLCMVPRFPVTVTTERKFQIIVYCLFFFAEFLNHPLTHPISQSINQPISQSVNQPIIHSVNLPVTHMYTASYLSQSPPPPLLDLSFNFRSVAVE